MSVILAINGGLFECNNDCCSFTNSPVIPCNINIDNCMQCSSLEPLDLDGGDSNE